MPMNKTDVSPRNAVIPAELKEQRLWALWNRADKNKQPLKLDGSAMRWKKEPETILSFEDVSKYPNIETFITLDSGIIGVDIDGCIDENGEIHPIVKKWLGYTYAEKSPGGNGIKMWIRGKMPNDKGFENIQVPWGVPGQHIGIEVYTNDRPFTVTGKIIEGCPSEINEVPEVLAEIIERFTPAKKVPQPKKNATTLPSKGFWALAEWKAWVNKHLDVIEEYTDCFDIVCPWKELHTTPKDTMRIWYGPPHTINCFHSHCKMRAWEDVRVHGEPTAYDKRDNLVPYIPSPQHSSTGNGNGNGHVPPTGNPDLGHDNQRAGIIINNAQLRDVTKEAMAALHALPATNDRLFVHFSQLSRVVKDEDDRPIVQQMGIASVKGELSEAADFYRIRKDQKTEETVLTAVSPTNEIAEQILALPPYDWHCPSLKGVTEVPLVKPDGTLLDKPGYDKKLKVFYDPSEDLKDLQIPEECTQEDAIKAVAVLKHVIAEFPFEGPADIANMLGLLITPFIRHAFKGDIQLALLDATNPGTGKTFLAQIVAILATGTRTEARSQKGDDDEWRKFILAVLLKCPQIVLIDNVRGTLAAVSLEAALTSETISDRLLGVSKDVSATNTAVWMVTGNNLLIGGDLARRCFRIRLIATDANPDERDDYDIPDILDYCEAHRKELVVAILTMIKAWFQAGKPAPSVKISKADSFGPWIKMVGGILDFAGVQGWQQNREELRSKNNEEAKEWERFLNAWTTCYGEKWKKTIDVQKDVINGSPFGTIEDALSTMLFEAVPSLLAEKFVRNRDGFYLSLARALALRRQTVFGVQGFQIEKQEDSHTKNLMWRVTTKKSPENDPENNPKNKSEKEPPQMGQSIIKSDKATSGFSPIDENAAVVCGGSTYPLACEKSESSDFTNVTHNIYSPGSQGVQSTAYHRNPQNDPCGKVPSEHSTSGGKGTSDETKKTSICGGSFQNSESSIEIQGISEEHIDLFIEYVGVVRSSEKPVLDWYAPGRDCKKSPFGKDAHIMRTHSLLRSGDEGKVSDALAAMQCTVEKYSVSIEQV
jgi:hypothetical protein